MTTTQKTENSAQAVPAKSALDTARAELTQRHIEAQAELDRKFAVLEMLPPGEIPIVCNWRIPSPIEPRVWVSYSAPSYDPDQKYDPVALLQSIEAKGWSLIPEAALVKWDNYRRTMEPSALATVQAVPENERGSYRKLSDGDAVAPYWVTPEQYTKPDFACFMAAPDGLTYRVSVDVPTIGAHISARRKGGEFGREWYFERGSARLHTPTHWSIMPKGSGAWVDTEQGISGAVYFHADSVKKTASEALAFLLQKPAAT